jgi:hypothetical protein
VYLIGNAGRESIYYLSEDCVAVVQRGVETGTLAGVRISRIHKVDMSHRDAAC